MKIKGFLETSFVDWDGKICSVVFLPGCNFRCLYCHNHQLVLHPEELPDISWNEIKKKLVKNKGWIDGVCITGGEPAIHSDLSGLIKEIKSHSFLVKLDTNGSNPEILATFLNEGLIDYVAMDLKAPLNEKYTTVSGVKADLDKIKKSINIIMSDKIDYEFRITVVPGHIGKNELIAMAKEIKGAKKFILQNFNPAEALDINLRKVKPYSIEEMEEFRKSVEGYVEFCKVR